MSDREYELAVAAVEIFAHLALGVMILWAIEVVWMIWTYKREQE